MLTIRENLLETMKKGGRPDRFVNQFEFLNILFPSAYYMGNSPSQPGKSGYDQYGVFWDYPEGQLGMLPVHDDEHRLLTLDTIEDWKDIVKRPQVPADPAYWDMLKSIAAGTDEANQWTAAFHPQGLFERTHNILGMEDAMLAMYEEPEALHELIDLFVEVEMECFTALRERLGVNALFHHDDWGSADNSLLPPDLFEEFYLPGYRKIYHHCKDIGYELIVHHNDSYSANLVPFMIDMGMDIWQGPVPSNNIPALIEQYGGQITFMGEIETRKIDIPDWTQEAIAAEVERACRKCGSFAFIPCQTQGGPSSSFPGVYEAISKEIDRMSTLLF